MAPLLDPPVRPRPPISEDSELAQARELFLAQNRMVLSTSFNNQLVDGKTISEIANKAGMTPDVFRALLNVPDDMSIGTLGMMFYALEIETGLIVEAE